MCNLFQIIYLRHSEKPGFGDEESSLAQIKILRRKTAPQDDDTRTA